MASRAEWATSKYEMVVAAEKRRERISELSDADSRSPRLVNCRARRAKSMTNEKAFCRS